jgi:membrane protein
MKERLLAAVRFARFLWRRCVDDRCPQIAASLAFTTLLALAPVFGIAVALLSSAPFAEQVLVHIKVFLLLNLVPEIAHRIITVYMEEFARNAGRLTALGVVALFATAMAMMLTVERQIHAIWRERRTRPLWISVFAYSLLLIVGPLLIAISVSITTYLMSLSAEAELSREAHDFMLRAVPSIVSALAFFLIYKLLPHRRVEGLHAAAGAAFAGVLFEAAKEGFAFYVRNVPGYNVLYGTFVAIPFFLLWIYLSWLIVLLGAELTAALAQWPAGRPSGGREVEELEA